MLKIIDSTIKKVVLVTILVILIIGAILGIFIYEYVIESDNLDQYIIENRGAIQWQLNSGEAKALQYQSYNMATENLKLIAKEQTNKPKAVVLDIDETVLNNYGNIIDENIKTTEGYTKENFSKWSKEEKATVIPGAKEFLSSAKEMGVQIFYISNRYPDDLQSTMDNMKALGLPNSDSEHILLKSNNSNKINRVNDIRHNYDVVMFVGDNLNDFPIGFDHKNNIERKEIVTNNKNEFGTKYIIIPNAAYGDWQGATFGYDYKKTDNQKIKEQNKSLLNLRN